MYSVSEADILLRSALENGIPNSTRWRYDNYDTKTTAKLKPGQIPFQGHQRGGEEARLGQTHPGARSMSHTHPPTSLTTRIAQVMRFSEKQYRFPMKVLPVIPPIATWF